MNYSSVRRSVTYGINTLTVRFIARALTRQIGNCADKVSQLDMVVDSSFVLVVAGQASAT
jgi:hypothetical protein